MTQSLVSPSVSALVASLIAVMLTAASAGAYAAHSHGATGHGHHSAPASVSGPASASASQSANVSLSAPDGVSVEQCWIRSMPNNLPMAAYFVVKNDSSQNLELLGVRSDAFEHVMLHQTKSTGGMAKMAMAEKVNVPAKGTFVAEPGAYHVMLENAVKPLQVGTTAQMSFAFSGGTGLVADCQIKSPSSLRY